jgi:FkbM family methyltransferase
MKNALKRIAGDVIWRASSRSQRLRHALAPLGMRTQQQWFAGRDAWLSLPDGRQLCLSAVDTNYMTFELHWRGWKYYEPVTVLALLELLKDKQAMICAGANIGYYALIAAASYPALKVYGFEPHPKLFPIFKENASRNDLAVTCESMGLSDRSGTHSFFVAPSDMSGSLESKFQSKHIDSVEIRTTSIYDYLTTQNGVDGMLLKLVVEGHEGKVLRGATRTLALPTTELILAVVRQFDRETTTLLQDLGYRFYQLTSSGYHHQKDLQLCRRGDYVFLHYLVTRKTPAEVDQLYETLRPQISALDMRVTSYYRPDWERTSPFQCSVE